MKTQINALTATRAFAAIMVVIHHFGSELYPFTLSKNIFHAGNIAVSYFFVLSGFVLFIAYDGKRISYADYFKRRIGRIAPAYYLSLILMTFVAVGFLKYTLNANAAKEIGLSALFLQAYVPSFPLVLNSPAWSISVEMFFYLLFPAFLILLNRNIRLFVIGTVVLFVLAQYFHMKYYEQRWSLPDSIVDTVFFNPAMHINQFLIGMLGGWLYLKTNIRKWKFKGSSLLLLVVILLLIAYRPDSISYQVGLIAPVFMFFIVSTAVADTKVLNARPLVFLGEISYGIYILQFPVFKLLQSLNTSYMHIPAGLFFFNGLVVLLLTATASYYLLEQPLRRMISGVKGRG